MKNGRVMGIVGAGAVHRSFLARMPALLHRIGPIKAASFRVARRISNTLRAGEAIKTFAGLEPCDLIWLVLPDTELERVSRDLATITLTGKIAVVCGSARESSWFSPLVAAGARVATLNSVEESGERLFVAEGHPAAIGELRRLLTAEKRKLIELRPASKALYLSGIYLATHILLPWIAGSVESLREAGLSRVEATQVANALGARALRAYAKAGPKAWSPAAAAQLRQSIDNDLPTIRNADEKLASLYAKGVEQALQYFQPQIK
jgi:hypothetical protein